jgi:hypothetical protein
MIIGVSHDLDTSNVVLVDAAAKTIYDLTPSKAHQLASQLRAAAASGVSVFEPSRLKQSARDCRRI